MHGNTFPDTDAQEQGKERRRVQGSAQGRSARRISASVDEQILPTANLMRDEQVKASALGRSGRWASAKVDEQIPPTATLFYSIPLPHEQDERAEQVCDE